MSITTKVKGMYAHKHGEGEKAWFDFTGYSVLIRRRNALAAELDRPDLAKAGRGTMKAWREYQALCELGREKNRATGWRSESELTFQLKGLEGMRVEVVDRWGEKRRFQVGKSTGWMPIHLEIAKSNSSGGPAVSGAPFKSVRIL
jgi:hypothetical protein